jgi:hypothetical protein
MRYYWLTLVILAVWRVTHLLYAEDGPWDLFVKLRKQAGEGFWGSLLDCFYCLSLWIALPLSIWMGASWMERVLLWPALSAGAILLERVTANKQAPTAAYHFENEEEHDVLFREENNDAIGRRV